MFQTTIQHKSNDHDMALFIVSSVLLPPSNRKLTLKRDLSIDYFPTGHISTNQKVQFPTAPIVLWYKTTNNYKHKNKATV